MPSVFKQSLQVTEFLSEADPDDDQIIIYEEFVKNLGDCTYGENVMRCVRCVCVCRVPPDCSDHRAVRVARLHLDINLSLSLSPSLRSRPAAAPARVLLQFIVSTSSEKTTRRTIKLYSCESQFFSGIAPIRFRICNCL